MSVRKPKIPFFTDNDVPDAVGDYLLDSNHECKRLRDVILADSPDPIVAATCRQSGMVLITHNIKHFKAIVKEHEVNHKEADSLCRIELGCKQIVAVERLEAAMSIIEHEWVLMGPVKQGMRIFVGDNVIRVHR